MRLESSFLMDVWELMRDLVPASRRNETAVALIRAFEEYGIDSKDLVDVIDEDDALTAGYKIVFGYEEEEEEILEGFED